jgi:hypothetical protein
MTDPTRHRQLKVIEDTRGLIKRHGWALIGVFPAEGDTGQPFTYTVGLTEQFLPELVVYGLDPNSAAAVLNTVAANMVDKGEIKAGDRLADVLTDGRTLAVIDLDAADAADLAMVHNIYGTLLSARQVVWPDSDGKFPWEQWNSVHPQKLSGGPPF